MRRIAIIEVFEVIPKNEGGCLGTIIGGFIAIFIVLAMCNLPCLIANRLFGSTSYIISDVYDLQHSNSNTSQSTTQNAYSPPSTNNNTTSRQSSPQGTTMCVSTVDGSNAVMRSSASSSGEKLARLRVGTCVRAIRTVIGQEISKGISTWWEVEYKGQTGYIYSRLLR